MAVLPIIRGGIRSYVPRFSDGTAGGAGGTVSDGGQPGRVTFSLTTSGDTDPADGIWIAWPARDVLGRALPDLPASLASALDVRTEMPQGMAEITEVSGPTAGNGMRVGVAVVAADAIASVVSTAAQGFGAEVDFAATPGVRGSRITSAGWAITAIDAHSDIVRARVAGDLLRNAAANGMSVEDVERGARFPGDAIIGSANQGDSVYIVVYAYRTGASTGTETATVDVRARLLTSGVTA